MFKTKYANETLRPSWPSDHDPE